MAPRSKVDAGTAAAGRIENRTVDGAANPYLAPAVMLAAGLDGIEHRIPAGKRNDRNLYEVPLEELKAEDIGFLPTTLSEALDELEKDEVVREALGHEYAQYYVRVKREEWKREGVPMGARRGQLLERLNALYRERASR